MKVLAIFSLLIVAVNARSVVHSLYDHRICKLIKHLTERMDELFPEIGPTGFNFNGCIRASLKDNELYLLQLGHNLYQVPNLDSTRRQNRDELVKEVSNTLNMVMKSVGRVCKQTVALVKLASRIFFNNRLRVNSNCHKVYFTNVEPILVEFRNTLKGYRSWNRRNMRLRGHMLRMTMRFLRFLTKSPITTPQPPTTKAPIVVPKSKDILEICKKIKHLAERMDEWFPEIGPTGFNFNGCIRASLKDNELYLLQLGHNLYQVPNLDSTRRQRRDELVKEVSNTLNMVINSVRRVCRHTVILAKISSRIFFNNRLRVNSNCHKAYFTNVEPVLVELRNSLNAYQSWHPRVMRLRGLMLRRVMNLLSLLSKSAITTLKPTTKITTPIPTTEKITTPEPTTKKTTPKLITEKITPPEPTTKKTTLKHTTEKITTPEPTTKKTTLKHTTEKIITTEPTTTTKKTTLEHTTEKITTPEATTIKTTSKPTTEKITTTKPTTKVIETTPDVTTKLPVEVTTVGLSNRCPYTDDTHIKRLVDTHNNIREKINDGYDVPSSDVNMPPANPKLANLEWDPKLAKQAQDYIDQCKFEPSSEESRTSVHGYDKVGENIYSRNLSSCEGCSRLIPTYVAAFSWLGEAKHYSNNGNLCPAMQNLNSLQIDGKYVGNFINMISSSVTKFGCGRSICGCQMLVKCLYGESGHGLNKPVYEFDECSK